MGGLVKSPLNMIIIVLFSSSLHCHADAVENAVYKTIKQTKVSNIYNKIITWRYDNF